jgi:hypothetical protein
MQSAENCLKKSDFQLEINGAKVTGIGSDLRDVPILSTENGGRQHLQANI